MKNCILLLTLLLINFSCSQSKNTKMNMKQNPEINSKNIAEEITKKVIKYDKSPIYLLNFTVNKNYPEIYVNDIKIYKNFDRSSGGSAININPYLINRDKQFLKIVMNANEEKLSFQSEIEINIETYDIKNKFNDISEKDLFYYKTPEGSKIKDKDYYEETITFNLPNVPYKIDGWKESQDLRNFDKKILEERVLEAYKMIEKAFKEKDLDKIAQFSYNKIKDQAVSQYFDKDEVQEGWDELASIAGAENLEFFPLEDYELVFYGDGKLVGLKSKKKDKGFRGASALLCKFKKEGNWTGAELDYLLHIPKGKTEFEVY